VCLAPHSNGQVLYYRLGQWVGTTFLKSTNGGTSWSQVDGASGWESGIAIPWYAPNWDDSVIMHCEDTRLAYSVDGGVTWTIDTPGDFTRPKTVIASEYRNDLFYIFAHRWIHEYEIGVGDTVIATLDLADQVFDGVVLSYDSDRYAEYLLAVGSYPGGGPLVELWLNGGGTSDKRGNLPTLTGDKGIESIVHPMYVGEDWP